jgi:RNA polymerase sigma-70 factor (ECF subfamily)
MATPSRTGPPVDPAVEIDALRQRDERVLAAVLDRDYPVTLRLAALLNVDRPKENARTAWLELFDRGDVGDAPTLRTWLLRRIVEGATLDLTHPRPARADARFEADDSLWAGHWASSLAPWPEWRHRCHVVEEALRGLPPVVAAVVVLRDVDRLSSEEVEAVLGLDSEEQRVLLHEGRTGVRDALDTAAAGGEEA